MYGGLAYTSQNTYPIIGTKSGTTRTAVTLASTYTQSKTFEVGGFSKLDIAILYTMGATETANSIECKVESSPDGTNFYRIANEAVSGGTSTLTAREFTFVGADAAAATISVALDIWYKYVKVSFKESGVVTNAGTVYAEVTLSGQ